MKSKQQVAAIIAALKELYPDALCSLDYQKDICAPAGASNIFS